MSEHKKRWKPDESTRMSLYPHSVEHVLAVGPPQEKRRGKKPSDSGDLPPDKVHYSPVAVQVR
jgi:hypothetical protein